MREILITVSLFYNVFLFGQSGNWMYQVEKLGRHLNLDIYDEIAPVVTQDGRTLYFTRVGYEIFDRTLIENDLDISEITNAGEYEKKLREIYTLIAGQPIKNPVSSHINQDIWMAMTERSLFDRVIHPTYPLNNALPNSVCSMGGENTLIIVNQFSRDGGMTQGFSKVTYKPEIGWSFPAPIHIYDFDTKGSQVNLSMSEDEEVIILSRQNGEGNMDLYVSFRISENLYSKGVNLGSDINSEFKDFTPHITADKLFLLFSSDRDNPGHANDIYISKRLDDTWTRWAAPVKLPAPVNSGYNDQYPYLNEKYMMLYFTSTRDGSSDIFRARIFPDSLISDKYEPSVVLPPRKAEKEEPNQKLRIKTINSVTHEPESCEIFYKDLISNEIKSIYAFTGEVEIEIDDLTQIEFQARKENYFSRNIVFKKHQYSADANNYYYLRLVMDPLEKGNKLTINPIRFERGTDRILPESYPDIEKLAEILKNNKNLSFLITGHTDNVGDRNALLELSNNRALAVKKLLVEAGAGENQVRHQGMGADEPISDNSSEKMRAVNRRVEILITRN